MLAAEMELADELDRIAAAAGAFAEPGETLDAVIPTEPGHAHRIYLCSYAAGESRSWLALDEAARPVQERALVRDAVAIAAMCEIAEETAGGGDVERLRAELRELRETENPEGIEEAEEAALALERVLAEVPRIASPTYLDAVGAAVKRLEHALGEDLRSPFAETMKGAAGAVDELKLAVEAAYKAELR
jgi:hypothetical protein